MLENIDKDTVKDFGNEWQVFDQTVVSDLELGKIFSAYFSIFPWDKIKDNAEGFDLGCGSGRWAKLVAPKVGRLYCIDASSRALAAAQKKLTNQKNVIFLNNSVSDISLSDNSMDFGYSLGVLHHVPDTYAGIEECVRKLKKGAPFLLYLYYKLDNKPIWYRNLWRLSNLLRKILCKLPFTFKFFISQLLALMIYYPLARAAFIANKTGINVENWPLSNYKNRSFYIMRNDSLDRFGTRLEKRFSKQEIHTMLSDAGLDNIVFSTKAPYWCVVGFKK